MPKETCPTVSCRHRILPSLVLLLPKVLEYWVMVTIVAVVVLGAKRDFWLRGEAKPRYPTIVDELLA